MSVIEIIAGALLAVISVIVIVSVLLQEHDASISALTGASGGYSSRGRTNDAMLQFITKIAGIALVIITIGFYVVTMYV